MENQAQFSATWHVLPQKMDPRQLLQQISRISGVLQDLDFTGRPPSSSTPQIHLPAWSCDLAESVCQTPKLLPTRIETAQLARPKGISGSRAVTQHALPPGQQAKRFWHIALKGSQATVPPNLHNHCRQKMQMPTRDLERRSWLQRSIVLAVVAGAACSPNRTWTLGSQVYGTQPESHPRHIVRNARSSLLRPTAQSRATRTARPALVTGWPKQVKTKSRSCRRPWPCSHLRCQAPGCSPWLPPCWDSWGSRPRGR